MGLHGGAHARRCAFRMTDVPRGRADFVFGKRERVLRPTSSRQKLTTRAETLGTHRKCLELEVTCRHWRAKLRLSRRVRPLPLNAAERGARLTGRFVEPFKRDMSHEHGVSKYEFHIVRVSLPETTHWHYVCPVIKHPAVRYKCTPATRHKHNQNVLNPR